MSEKDLFNNCNECGTLLIKCDCSKFIEWLKELKTLLVLEFGFNQTSAERYGLVEHWRGYFENNYSPKDALQEDFSDA